MSPQGPPLTIGLNAVIVAVTREVPRILTVRWRRQLPVELDVLPSTVLQHGQPLDALPFGPLDPERDAKLEAALRRWVREQTGLDLGYVEQLYTFGDLHRDPVSLHAGPRSVSVAYLALVRQSRTSGQLGADWQPIYRFFPWEDWRPGRPDLIDTQIEPALNRWAAAARDSRERRARRERAEITFGLGEAGWDGDRVLERYELLYEIGLVAESWWDRAYRAAGGATSRSDASTAAADPTPHALGRAMAVDHRRMLAAALGRLRGKIKYRPVVFELLPPEFTLLQLQRVVEALAGVRLHKGNFRRLVEKGRLVEGTGRLEPRTGGRPAELFSFRREVLRERKAPGVGIPGLPWDDQE